ncbi:MAG TPA: hypothetical protein VFI29_15690 [Hanamia sp.]|nr:hypothetical protein [Hanamia sp.]
MLLQKEQASKFTNIFRVGLDGCAMGYDIFEGNIYEGRTLIPFIEKIATKFNPGKPIIVADSGLLLKDIIIAMEEKVCE